MKSNWSKYLGPGPLIAAAFIGPGTVTVCTLAGVNFGYDLLWALLLSIITTIILQESAARIGLVTQVGLASNISKTIQKAGLRYFSISLVLLAIVLGNAAYEAGNISGGSLGAEIFFDLGSISLYKLEISLMNLLIGFIALLLLLSGSYKAITKILTLLVILMSLAFLLSAFMVKPVILDLLKGMVPVINPKNIITIVALIGTTVVPYNLFLHSSLVTEKWKNIQDLKYVRFDTMLAVILGGIVSMAIVITGAAGSAMDVSNATDLAKGLEPLMGAASKYFIAFGLFAAGITSAVTAPLAGSLVITGCFGWSTKINGKPMRWSIVLILGLGLIFASFGIRPVQLITIAQLANGVLLPLLSGYVIWLVNKKSLMGEHRNSRLLNLLSVVVWLITLLLGALSVMKVFGII
ncbi:divalent metal cation transporter [Cyclobacteriaceae bacterium YHN15]|jgi:manganese transport protein|nr:divalent metal cation transporter [Cyclobacteriaceae bacterium YHN15]